MKFINSPDQVVHSQIVTPLLEWYDQNARVLPWRYGHDDAGNPYHTWLSEIMLQQTVVAAVLPYFQKFISIWPTIYDLAAASQDEVLTAWQGLGYYSRGRNLLKCAQIIVDQNGGEFPKTVPELRQLPGIGPYTADAIASIAFRVPVVPVDGNVIRVFSRLFGLLEPLPSLKSQIEEMATTFDPGERPGDFAQALMDLGATICRPKSPDCQTCPLVSGCLSHKQGIASDLPKRRPKPKKPTRYGYSFIVTDPRGHIVIQKRTETGLLAGMAQVPTTLWSTDQDTVDQEFETLAGSSKVTKLEGVSKHTFTHFHLETQVVLAGYPDFQPQGEFELVAPSDLSKYALPTVMKKILTFSGP